MNGMGYQPLLLGSVSDDRLTGISSGPFIPYALMVENLGGQVERRLETTRPWRKPKEHAGSIPARWPRFGK
jgi:hypothetical protein